MTLVKVSFHSDNARDIIETVGTLDLVELRDLRSGTSFYNRSFVDDVRKCEDLARILDDVGAELSTLKITAPEWPPEDELGANGLPKNVPKLESFEPFVRELDQELELAKDQLKALKSYHNTAKEALHVLVEGRKVYAKAASKVGGSGAYTGASGSELELLPLREADTANVAGSMQIVCGIVKNESVQSLQRVIWRATRCNAVFCQSPIDEALLDIESLNKGNAELINKTFFMVFLVAKNSADKVKKISSYFGAELYPFPQGAAEYSEKLEFAKLQLDEATLALKVQEDQIFGVLSKVSIEYSKWVYVVARETMIFDALNKSDYDIKRSNVTSIEGWVPTESLAMVQQTLTQSEVAKGRTPPLINEISSRLTPPTFIPVTAFSSGFQALVNTYGTPRYREANPGAFCCIMFPYLFGIMFGDFGHGLLLAAFGLYLISKEKEWSKAKLSDMVEMVYGGRYILLLNGLFGAFVGIMYNEAFAFPMAIFGRTNWKDEAGDPVDLSHHTLEIPLDGEHPYEPYVVGVDPIWHHAGNKITFFNSLKMKISIVVGVAQMSVGIFLSLLNHFEYRDYKKVFFQFIPEIIFFEGIFGYLVFTIFLKWATDWVSIGEVAPSLLNLLIMMFMSPSAPIDNPLYGHQCYYSCSLALADGACAQSTIAAACPASCAGDIEHVDTLSPGAPGEAEVKVCFSEIQSQIQIFLLVISFVSVPFLLLPIPFIEMYQHSKSTKSAGHERLGEEDEGDAHGGDHHGEEFSVGDAFIHQGIHTIEFVLGSISNTASYLRLWALSLAHSQLAELFKDMVLGLGLSAKSELGLEKDLVGNIIHVFVLWFTYATWLIMSFVVLMVMENLSSFLHALRLQWVEFQNKFFYGDGVRFTPFSFKNIAVDVSDDE
jgi:V-type H+-transporting ATPase subunit a